MDLLCALGKNPTKSQSARRRSISWMEKKAAILLHFEAGFWLFYIQ